MTTPPPLPPQLVGQSVPPPTPVYDPSAPATAPTAVLPYATPFATAASQPDAVWRDGRYLLIHQAAQMPPMCVKCGGPVHRSVKRTLYWHNPLLYLLILPGILIYAIVAMCVRETVKLDVPLCDRHYRRRGNRLMAAWLAALLGLGLLVLAIVYGDSRGVVKEYLPVFVIAGIFVPLGALVFGLIIANPVTPKKIENGFAWLKGVHERVLETLPPAYPR